MGTPARPNAKVAGRRPATEIEVKSAWEGPTVPDRHVDPNIKFKSKHKINKVGFSKECELIEFPEKGLGPHLDDASWKLPSAMRNKQLDDALATMTEQQLDDLRYAHHSFKR